MNKKVCGAQLRGKKKGVTCRKTPMANGKCRLHGGATPSGPDNPNFKHGRYANVFKGKLADKFQRADTEKKPLDFIPELQAQRALLEQYLDDITSRKKLKLGEIINASTLAQDVVRSGAMIVKSRNEQAFTVAEIRFFQKAVIMLMEKYVPNLDDRRNFIADIIALIPERNATSEDEPESLSIGAGTTSKVT